MKIELTPLELKVLKKSAKRAFNPDLASIEEQDAEISLLEKASEYENSEPGLIHECFEYTRDCNLLIWFWYRYQLQEGKVKPWNGVMTNL